MASSQEPFSDVIQLLDEEIPAYSNADAATIREPKMPPRMLSRGERPGRSPFLRVPSLYSGKPTFERPQLPGRTPSGSWLSRRLSRKESSARAYARKEITRKPIGPAVIDVANLDLFMAFSQLGSHDKAKFELKDITRDEIDSETSSQMALINEEPSVLNVTKARYVCIMFALCLTFSLVSRIPLMSR